MSSKGRSTCEILSVVQGTTIQESARTASVVNAEPSLQPSKFKIKMFKHEF